MDFSTGVLRGHEGSPLVIGDTGARAHAPNNVFALDLETQKIKWIRAQAGSCGHSTDKL
jgi:glucose dehydrogenase